MSGRGRSNALLRTLWWCSVDGNRAKWKRLQRCRCTRLTVRSRVQIINGLMERTVAIQPSVYDGWHVFAIVLHVSDSAQLQQLSLLSSRLSSFGVNDLFTSKLWPRSFFTLDFPLSVTRHAAWQVGFMMRLDYLKSKVERHQLVPTSGLAVSVSVSNRNFLCDRFFSG